MGRVTGLTITDSGTQYSTIPTVTISLPDQDSSNATATAILNQDGNVSGFTITDNGSYYTSVPTITIGLPDEDSANATASVSVNDSGYIENITLNNAGTYYTTTPNITISAPDAKPLNWVTSYSGQSAKWGNYSYKLNYQTDDSDYTNFTNIDGLGGSNTTELSLEFWINIPASRTGDVMLFPTNHSDGSNNKVSVEGNNLRWSWTEGNGSTGTSIVTFDNPLIPQTWHFVQLIRDYNNGTSDHKLYIDGVIKDYTDNRPNVDNFIQNKIRLVNSIGSDGILLDAIRFNLDTDTVLNPIPDSDRNPYDDASDSNENYLGFHLVTAAATANVVNGSLDSIVVTNPGNGYYKSATATIDSATGTKADFRATATGVLTNGALSSITLTDSGSFYTVAPVVTIDSATGNKSDFRATARATIDSSSGELATLVITDSGNFYDNVPTVTISAPTTPKDFIIGENVTQTIADGVIMTGEVSSWNDSSERLGLIHVGADDGLYHNFVTNTIITGATSGSTGIVTLVQEEDLIKSDVTETEDNQYYDTLVDFLDFSEGNPFGDPS